MSQTDKTFPALRKNGPLAGLLVYSAFIIWASLSGSGNSAAISHFDKVLHIAVYAILAGLACWVWPKMAGWKIWLGATLYGGLMELCQGAFTQGRTPSLADALANAIGAALMVLIRRSWLRYRAAKT